MPEDSIETEIKDKTPPPPERFGRRKFFKKVAIGAAAIGATALGWRESQTIESGIQTATGTFYPLYERHDQGIDEKDLPDDLGACFFEFAKEQRQGWLYGEEPAVLLYNCTIGDGRPKHFKTPRIKF